MKAKPSRSPARQALADAIAGHKDAKATHDRLRTARARASGAVVEAERIVGERAADLEKARGDHVDMLSAGLSAGVDVTTAAPLGVREARLALGEAEDDLVTARQVLQACERKLAPLPEPVDLADPDLLDGHGNPIPAAVRASEQHRAEMAAQLAAHPLESYEVTLAKAVRAVEAEHAADLAVAAVREAREAYLDAVRKGAAAVEILRRVELTDALADVLHPLASASSADVPVALLRRNSVDEWTVTSLNVSANNSDPQRSAAAYGPAHAWQSAAVALASNPDAELPTL